MLLHVTDEDAPCDLAISEHEGPCANPEHTAARARRAAGAPSWSAIEHGSEGGGPRDYLDGQPIHCGDGLELQSIKWSADDYGEFTLKQATGTRVRYERSGGDVVLYATIGGHSFASGLQGWMRFRWPQKG